VVSIAYIEIRCLPAAIRKGTSAVRMRQRPGMQRTVSGRALALPFCAWPCRFPCAAATEDLKPPRFDFDGAHIRTGVPSPKVNDIECNHVGSLTNALLVMLHYARLCDASNSSPGCVRSTLLTALYAHLLRSRQIGLGDSTGCEYGRQPMQPDDEQEFFGTLDKLKQPGVGRRQGRDRGEQCVALHCHWLERAMANSEASEKSPFAPESTRQWRCRTRM
jgi:hypothetical protein